MSRFRTALDLDTYPLSSNFIRPRAPNGLNAVEVSQCSLCIIIGFLACFHAISLERSHFSKIASAHYAYWLFRLFSRHISRTSFCFFSCPCGISLISHLVACSPRIVVDRHTHRTTTVTLTAHVLIMQVTLCMSSTGGASLGVWRWPYLPTPPSTLCCS